MIVYMCEPRLEGILCGVYGAWSEPAGHGSVRSAIKGEYEELELFVEYREVQSYPEKAKKVIRSARAKLSQEIYRKVYAAPLSQDRDRVDKVYRFLIQASRHGPSGLDMLQFPVCYDIFGLCRNVYNENHLLTRFLRFSETSRGTLVSRIGPKNNIMTLLAPHFADRLPEKNWIIYDENHKRAAAYLVGRSWSLVNHPLEPEQESSDQGWSCWLKKRTDEETYEDMWRMFCDTIVMRERHNPICQRTHLLLCFRLYMTEFQKQMGQKAQWSPDGFAGGMLWKICMENMCGKHVWKTPETFIEDSLDCPL